MVNIHYIRQKEPKGLGHAIYCAKSFIANEPFAVLLGDDIVYSDKPCLRQLMEVYEKYNVSILGTQRVDEKDVNKYGIIEGFNVEEDIIKVKALVEKPDIKAAKSNVAILGRYIITPAIFDILENQKPGKNGEIQLTDALLTLSNKEAMYAYLYKGKRYDVGDKLGYLQATVEFALRKEELKEEFGDYLKEIVKGF